MNNIIYKLIAEFSVPNNFKSFNQARFLYSMCVSSNNKKTNCRNSFICDDTINMDYEFLNNAYSEIVVIYQLFEQIN